MSDLVAVQFPDLAGQAIARLGAGWDHELFCVGDQWILRFPRRAEPVPWLAREITITAMLVLAMYWYRFGQRPRQGGGGAWYGRPATA